MQGGTGKAPDRVDRCAINAGAHGMVTSLQDMHGNFRAIDRYDPAIRRCHDTQLMDRLAQRQPLQAGQQRCTGPMQQFGRDKPGLRAGGIAVPFGPQRSGQRQIGAGGLRRGDAVWIGFLQQGCGCLSRDQGRLAQQVVKKGGVVAPPAAPYPRPCATG